MAMVQVAAAGSSVSSASLDASRSGVVGSLSASRGVVVSTGGWRGAAAAPLVGVRASSNDVSTKAVTGVVFEPFSEVHILSLGYGHLLPCTDPHPRFWPSSPSFVAMATLRTFSSISTFLNPSPLSLPRFSNPRRITPLIPRLNHAKPLSQSKPSSSNPTKLSFHSNPTFQGLEHLEISPTLKNVSFLGSFVSDHARELAIGSLVFAIICLPDEHALALGPGGPLMEEFWDNVRRYGFYFFTVVSGGLYSLAKPLLDLMKDPSTQILVAVVVIGTFYLMYLTVSTMLGLNDFVYEYAQ